jgi:CheY-like chemotaxis protein
LPNDFSKAFADRTRFAQILMNFGSNAIKYGRKGGRVVFEAEVVDNRIRITVTDDGVGISAEKQSKIFQPFQRAGQETGPIEGTGIGLSISKRLAELMGGQVDFRSARGKGSEFWVELQIHEQPVAKIDPGTSEKLTSSRLRNGEGPQYTILYVEDNPSNIAFMDAVIADFDRVLLLAAPTAEIGIELARSRLPKAILMDINLPGMSGYDALRQLREWPETRNIPVVALSAAAMERDKRRAEQAGFYGYITKPVRVTELTSVLEALLIPEPSTVNDPSPNST